MSVQHAPQVPAAESKAASRVSLSRIRSELEQQRQFRTEQLEQLSRDMADAVAGGDEARLQVMRALAVSADAALDDINAALSRLDTGDFGVCEDCGKPIPMERLEVLPMSRFCTPCQYRLDTARGGRNARRAARR